MGAILKLAAFIFLIYLIIRMFRWMFFFRDPLKKFTQQREEEYERQKKQKKKYEDKEGEYIDYKEVKDKKS